MFLVSKKTGDRRSVINLKPLNEFVAKIHFKMEGVHLVHDLVKPGDYLATIDLKDAYFSIPIFPKIFSFLMEQNIVPIYMSSFWLQKPCSKSIY